MPVAPAVNDDQNSDGKGPSDVVQQWRDELERAEKEMKDWHKDAKEIFERLRLKKASGDTTSKPKYGVLWSNIQTMAPALYAKPPKAIVGRRYLDKDPVARIASRILERAIQYMIDAGDLDRTVKQCVRDRLAISRGVAWCRYEPTIEHHPMPEDIGSDENVTDPETQTLEQLVWEMVAVDYVHWRDFRHDPDARWWEEVSWVARRAYMNRRELVARFGEEVGNAVPLGGDKDKLGTRDRAADAPKSKATVWEVWDKSARQVVWIAEDFDQVLDEKPDPLKLSEFFPCPRPLYGALTNDSLIPTPDYAQYEGQAKVMDETSARIAALVRACRVLGVYNNKFDVLGRLFTEGAENTLFPVSDWNSFSQKEGLKGALDFIPVDIFAKVLEELSKAREATKSEINEISGIADILRGQADAGETATGVQRKGQFATLRLNDEQAEVARFVRDIIRIMGEIVCELFDPITLAQMASVQEMTELQIQVPAGPPPGAPPAMMGHNGGPPLDGGLPPPGPGMAPGGAPLPPQHLPMMAGPHG